MLYTGNDLELAKKTLKSAQETGKTSVKLYQIRQINGKKFRKVYNPNKRVQPAAGPEVDELGESVLAEIRRLAGLK